MPRSGVGTSFSETEGLSDLTAIQPSPLDTWEALFRQAAQRTPGRIVIERYFIEHNKPDQRTMTIKQANQKYQIHLKQTDTSQLISENSAAYLQRRNIESQLDLSSIQQGHPSTIEISSAFLVGNLTDPFEAGVILILGRVIN